MQFHLTVTARLACSLEVFLLLGLDVDLLDELLLSPIDDVIGAKLENDADANDAAEAEVGANDAVDGIFPAATPGPGDFFRRNKDFPRGNAGKILVEMAPTKRSR